jgi:hypothetical protein
MRHVLLPATLAALAATALAACERLAGPAELLLANDPPTVVAVVTATQHITVPLVCDTAAGPACRPLLSYYELTARVPYPAESIRVTVGDSTPVFVESGLRVVRTTAADIVPPDSIQVWSGPGAQDCSQTQCQRLYQATRIVIDR